MFEHLTPEQIIQLERLLTRIFLDLNSFTNIKSILWNANINDNFIASLELTPKIIINIFMSRIPYYQKGNSYSLRD